MRLIVVNLGGAVAYGVTFFAGVVSDTNKISICHPQYTVEKKQYVNMIRSN